MKENIKLFVVVVLLSLMAGNLGLLVNYNFQALKETIEPSLEQSSAEDHQQGKKAYSKQANTHTMPTPFFLSTISTPSEGEQQTSTSNISQAKQHEDDLYTVLWAWIVRFATAITSGTHITDWLIAIATFAAVAVAVLQYGTFRIQAQVMRDTLLYDKRAYIYSATPLISAHENAQAGTATHFSITPNWINKGTTVGRQLITLAAFDDFGEEMPADFPYLRPSQNWARDIAGYIEPEQTRPANGFTLDVPYLDNLYRNQIPIYVWGWVEYSDLFEPYKRRRTEYCWRISVIADPYIPQPCLTIDRWGPHNGIDDDCFNKPMTNYIAHKGQ